MDADGNADLLIGRRYTTAPVLFYGPLAGAMTVSNADATFSDVYKHGGVARAGDTDADGYDDVLVGNLYGGSIHLYRGLPN